jgi:hypothetical protein
LLPSAVYPLIIFGHLCVNIPEDDVQEFFVLASHWKHKMDLKDISLAGELLHVSSSSKVKKT